MLLKPEVEHELVKFILLLLKWSTVVPFTVVIAESQKYRYIWERTCNSSLKLRMGIFEERV
jgi:hypothetical protein